MDHMPPPPRPRGGPIPHLRRQTPDHVKLSQGDAVIRAMLRGLSLRAAAGALGLSTTTAWRRYWLVMDWTLPAREGRPRGPIPPQRGTRACPSGRPWLPTLDTPPLRKPVVDRAGGLDVIRYPDGRRRIVWTTGAIARRMGLSRERIRQLTHTESWPAPVGKVGSARCWDADDIDQWLDQHRPDLVDGPMDQPIHARPMEQPVDETAQPIEQATS